MTTEVHAHHSASEVIEGLNVMQLLFSFEEGEEDSLHRVYALEQSHSCGREKSVITDFCGNKYFSCLSQIPNASFFSCYH